MACEVDSDVRCQEVRVGWKTQHLPVFVRMMDKDSNWTFNNGLKTLIPHALTFSLLGYHFCLPDMIGGNAYKTEYPERELFIRWMQANVFLPAIQFSITPWQYDKEVVDICKKMCQIHEDYADYIIQLAKECVLTGDPIIRPLWWINPGDDTTLEIDSEFLVGSKILVVPVLDPGATHRDIYFPLGKWKDENSGTIIEGPRWIKRYKAELHVLPYFTNVTTGVSPVKLSSAGQQKPENATLPQSSKERLPTGPEPDKAEEAKNPDESLNVRDSIEEEYVKVESNDVTNTSPDNQDTSKNEKTNKNDQNLDEKIDNDINAEAITTDGGDNFEKEVAATKPEDSDSIDEQKNNGNTANSHDKTLGTKENESTENKESKTDYCKPSSDTVTSEDSV